MPHKFDGTWKYFEMTNGGGATVPGRRDDLILSIPRDDGEVDADTSTQARFPVDGNATATGMVLTRTEPDIIRHLTGAVFFEKTIDGVLNVVIIGRFKDVPTDQGVDAQNEGTWVISKP